jgi:pimeloyl-ACP methyl ester carboxylesterase
MYGATEALCIAFAGGREVLDRSRLTQDSRGTFLGRPSRWVRTAVIAVSDDLIERWHEGLALPPGQIGEICVQGPVVTPRYESDHVATRRHKIADSAGPWHRMGDAGYVDADGGLWYCGRLSDAVLTPRGHLHTGPVEALFDGHPDVGRSALIGLPDGEGRYQRPVMLIEPATTLAGGAAVESRLIAELSDLAGRHGAAREVQEIRLRREPFPVDVRHGAKIRRDLLKRAEILSDVRTPEPLPASRSLLFEGHRVAYYEAGAGEPVLLLHNAGNDHHIWEHQIRRLVADHRVVAVDSLGYGRSDAPAIAYTLPLYIDMVAAAVDALQLAPVTIIGSCTGASMALGFALRRPQDVKRLVLFHIATPGTALGGGFEGMTRLLNGRPRLAGTVAPVVDRLMQRGLLHRGMIRSQYGERRPEDGDFARYLRRLYGRPGQAPSMMSLFAQWDSFGVLDDVQYPSDYPPLHVMWGGSNKLLTLERGRTLCETLRPHSFTTIEGGGHLVMHECRGPVTRHLLALLDAPDR